MRLSPLLLMMIRGQILRERMDNLEKPFIIVLSEVLLVPSVIRCLLYIVVDGLEWSLT